MRKYEEARELHGPRPPNRCRYINRNRQYCDHDVLPGEGTCDHHTPVNVVDEDIRQLPFAQDPQNVHRKEVSEQTNKATEFLLKIKPAETQETERELTLAWMSKPLRRMYDFLMVMTDVHGWFHTVTCRSAGDRLYFRLLRNLVHYIKHSEHKDELWERLWEECSDAVGMCCEGHISRLCNVLTGFVEGLGPQVSLGELMQQKMAAIAGQDIPEADKKRMANEFFDQHGVPDVDRVAWLDAF